jgi:hypothetical protein
MLLNLLWIAGFWLGLGFLAGLGLWLSMPVLRRLRRRPAAAVRAVPLPRPEAPQQPFQVLAMAGVSKPLALSKLPKDRRSLTSQLVSVPGGRH